MRSYIHRDKNIDIKRYRYIIHIDDVGTKLSSIVSCRDTTLMPCSIMILTLSCSGVTFCFYYSHLSFSLSISLTPDIYDSLSFSLICHFLCFNGCLKHCLTLSASVSLHLSLSLFFPFSLFLSPSLSPYFSLLILI